MAELHLNILCNFTTQVTNPPIDPIREEIVTSTETMVGARGGLLNPTPESCALIKLEHPLLTDEQLAKLRYVKGKGFQAATIPILFNVKDGVKGLGSAMQKMFTEADKAIGAGATILILSDRGVYA